ncbi:ESCRT-0 subunit protein hse1 [Coemansia thaxteri]|nr:ESCRT-0 subunit protein hse1 [Coemansia thaxteri]
MFKVPNPYDELVKKTTSELLTAENWELIMEVCDRVGADNEKARQCFEVITERLLHRNANVVLYSLTLVQSLLENCAQNVKQEVASRAFTTTLTRILNDKSVHDKVKSRVLGCIQQWAFDFRHDPTLSLMEETYTKLRAQRFAFPSPQKPEKLPKQSDIERQKEEEDLQLALAISLSSISDPAAAGGSARANYQTPAAIRSEITRKQTTAANLSPSAAGGVARRTTRVSGAPAASVAAAAADGSQSSKRKVQVKAQYDFTPTEPGELGFFKGDVIDVLDQKYRDWWKGELRGKSGIFPANFVQPLRDIRAQVSKDIDVEVEVFSEAHNIEALLRMLGSIDPMKDNVYDNQDVQKLYNSTLALRPRIMKLIEAYTKKKEELVLLDAQFSKSMQLYEDLMQRSNATPQSAAAGAAVAAPAYSQQQPPPQIYAPVSQQQSQQQQPNPFTGNYSAAMSYSQQSLVAPQQPLQQQPVQQQSLQQQPLQQQPAMYSQQQQQQPVFVPTSQSLAGTPQQHMYYQPQAHQQLPFQPQQQQQFQLQPQPQPYQPQQQQPFRQQQQQFQQQQQPQQFQQ